MNKVEGEGSLGSEKVPVSGVYSGHLNHSGMAVGMVSMTSLEVGRETLVLLGVGGRED